MRFPDVPLGEAVDGVLASAFDVPMPEIYRPEPLPLPSIMSLGQLVDALKGVAGKGGLTAVAAMAGVDRRTLQRHATGALRKPTARVMSSLRDAWTSERRKLQAAQRRRVRESEAAARQAQADARQAVRKRLTAAGGPIKLTGIIRISSDERRRTLDLGPYLTSGSRSTVIADWEADGPDGAGAAMDAAIQFDYQAGMEVISVEELTWT